MRKSSTSRFGFTRVFYVDGFTRVFYVDEFTRVFYVDGEILSSWNFFDCSKFVSKMYSTAKMTKISILI